MNALHPLERFVRAINRRRDSVRCDRCGESLRRQHRHLLHLDEHRLLCACPSCTVLTAGRRDEPYRVVPERVRHHQSLAPNREQWDALQIPGRLAFFVRLSRLARWAAVLPSAAGATEFDVPNAAWSAFVLETPPVQIMTSDVEALLVRAETGGSFDGYIAPIDLCYELVSMVRQNWRGNDGGDTLRAELDAFFERLRRLAASALPSNTPLGSIPVSVRAPGPGVKSTAPEPAQAATKVP